MQKMGFMDDDSRGFLFSMDLLIALIPLTIILGMMAADMDNMLYTVQDTVYQSSLERTGADTVNTLIKTSGTPYNWEETGSVTVVGLAKYNRTKQMPQQNYLSSLKMASLKQYHIQNLTGPGYGFFLNISTVNGSRTIKTVGTYNSSAPNIVKIERLVSGSGFEIVAEIKDDIRGTGKPLEYTRDFQTNNVTIQAYDYFVLIINRGYDSQETKINGFDVVPQNIIKKDVTEYVEKINDSYLQNYTDLRNNQLWVRSASTPENSMDVYVIAAPKGTDKSLINLDNIKGVYLRLLFYIWTT